MNLLYKSVTVIPNTTFNKTLCNKGQQKEERRRLFDLIEFALDLYRNSRINREAKLYFIY